MAQLLFGILSFLFSVILVFYFSVIAFQLVSLVFGGLGKGDVAKTCSYSALLQNVGILCALLAGLMRMTDLLMIGALLLALALLVRSQKSPELHRGVEASLLLAGLLGFGSLGLVHGII